MTATGYNQVLVMIDHFTRYAEAAPCMTASAEETCDHLINVWIARHGCPITFQSDNGKAFVGDLTKELMKRSQVAQAHSTTYHPQTNGLVERQNRTGIHAESLLLTLHGWLGQALAASDGCLQQHGAFHHGNKSAHDANGS